MKSMKVGKCTLKCYKGTWSCTGTLEFELRREIGVSFLCTKSKDYLTTMRKWEKLMKKKLAKCYIATTYKRIGIGSPAIAKRRGSNCNLVIGMHLWNCEHISVSEGMYKIVMIALKTGGGITFHVAQAELTINAKYISEVLHWVQRNGRRCNSGCEKRGHFIFSIGLSKLIQNSWLD